MKAGSWRQWIVWHIYVWSRDATVVVRLNARNVMGGGERERDQYNSLPAAQGTPSDKGLIQFLKMHLLKGLILKVGLKYVHPYYWEDEKGHWTATMKVYSCVVERIYIAKEKHLQKEEKCWQIEPWLMRLNWWKAYINTGDQESCKS